MVFVNYGGGKYWYFKHSSWNSEALPRGRLADLGPSSAPREAPEMRPHRRHLRPLPQPSLFPLPSVTLAPQCFLVIPGSAGVGASMWALQRVLERGYKVLILF